METYLIATVAFFSIIGLLHLGRALLGWPVLIKGYSVPRFWSFFAALVAIGAVWWGLSLLRAF